jgi:hypothetical protein
MVGDDVKNEDRAPIGEFLYLGLVRLDHITI